MLMVLVFERKQIWWYATEAAVGSYLVVFLPPGFDQEAGFIESGEPVFVEAFIAELAVEAFDESVLGGFAGSDEV